MTVLERATAPTPDFFKKLRLLGLILTTGTGVLVGGGQQLPKPIVDVAGYLAVAGSVLMAVSQVTVDEKALELKTTKKASGDGK